MKKLVLGSQSPRRKEILGFFSLPFIQASPPFDEEAVPFNGDPEDYVCTLSKGKGAALLSQFPESVILTADTIVFREGKVYGKPKDKEEAHRHLSELSGKWHFVYTGVTVQTRDKVISKAEMSRVLFNPLSPEQIDQYLDQIKWSDKAGGYAIQDSGGLIVQKIDGCYYNVKGLPINTVEHLLKDFGFTLWKHLA